MNANKEITVPLVSVDNQRQIILEIETEKSIATLKSNLLGKKFPKVSGVDYSSLDERIFLTQEQGWVAPPSDIVDAWFSQVKSLFSEYGTDEKLGKLLGVQGANVDRRIRAYRNGNETIPYGIWRKFLVLTGRVVPHVPAVIGIFDAE